MRQPKLVLSVLALFVAVVAAFAFSPKPAIKTGPQANYWLKFDCSKADEVQNTDNNRTADIPLPCIATPGTPCAKQFPEGALELNPNFPPGKNIYRLIDPNTIPLDTRYCP